MSKAFTREDDAAEFAPIRPLPTLPPGVKNYITPRGADNLRGDMEKLLAARSSAASTGDRAQIAHLDQRIGRLQQIIATIVPVGPAPACEGQVCFGATVSVKYPSGDVENFRLVGVNEIDLDRDWISWQSPLARALMNAKVGDKVRFKSPTGEQELEITAVTYE
jgi:transcription elongation factor GreB